MAKQLTLGSKEDIRLAIRRRSAEIAAKMTDREFFTCAQFTRYATQLADFILRRHRLYELDIQYLEDDQAPVAYTDGKKIFWNVGNSIAKGPKLLERRFKVNMGILFHEVAHKLFMDFKSHNQIMDQIFGGTLYGNFETNGNPDLEKALEELKKVTASPYSKVIASIYSDLCNRIGDGHDEAAMKQSFPGFIRECIEVAGEVQMENTVTLKDRIDSRADTYSIFSGLILQYSKFGYYLVGEENEDTETYVSLMRCLEPIIDMALEEHDYQKRFDHTNLLMLYLWPYLREKFPEDPNDQSGSSDNASAVRLSGGSSSGSSGTGSGASVAVSADALADAIQQAISEADQDGSATPAPVNCDESAVDPTSVSSDGKETGSSSDAASIAMSAAEEQATQEVQKEMDQAQKEILRNLKLPLIHRDIPFSLIRHNSEQPDLYQAIAKEVDPYVRNLVSSMLALLRDMNEEYLERHRVSGPVIDISDSHRRDKRFFSKRKLPDDQPDMAICILVDQSGSMSGRNLNYARKAAIMLERFSSALYIPTMIAGHNTRGHTCQLMIYTDFLSAMTEKDRHSIAGMDSSGANRDGYAVRLCAEMLARRPEEVKLMVVISDGSPADYGYMGDEAVKDVANTVTEFRRKGLLIYGAAIAEDREAIEKIYGRNFLNITDLKTLPKTMIRLIKSQIT